MRSKRLLGPGQTGQGSTPDRALPRTLSQRLAGDLDEGIHQLRNKVAMAVAPVIMSCELARFRVHQPPRFDMVATDRQSEPGNTSERLRSVSARTQYDSGRINVNKEVTHFSIKKFDDMESITVEFKDGCKIDVNLELESIEAVFIVRESEGLMTKVDLTDLNKIMTGSIVINAYKIVTGNSEPKESLKFDELVFERSDGTSLILRLKPGAIRTIVYEKGNAGMIEFGEDI